MSGTIKSRTTLLKTIVCPHCWERFPPEEIKWVSVDPSLLGDPRIGEEGQRRFLPVRFDPFCRAIDPEGGICSDLACPRCHLVVPRAVLEMPPLFLSILGAPGAGKSYFLAAALWRLRRTLKRYFLLDFLDADPAANTIVNDYVARLFNPNNWSAPVALEKTEKDGELYQTVQYDDRLVTYPRPFLFVVRPSPGHPRYRVAHAGRVLCLYDNAGEHFLPGGESSNSPGTRHLVESSGLIFLLDPLQVAVFREAVRKTSDDPQLTVAPWTYSQDRILDEVGKRIRVHARLPQGARIPKPLVVAVTKYDVWKPLLGNFDLDLGVVLRRGTNGICGLVPRALAEISARVRRLLLRFAPEIVSAAEALTDDVCYLPVTALGCSPEVTHNHQLFVVRPAKLKPQWVELPFINLMYKAKVSLIPVCMRRQKRVGEER